MFWVFNIKEKWLPCYFNWSSIWIFEYLNIWIFEYLIIEYLNIWIFEYLNIWIFEYLNIWIFEYMNIWIFEQGQTRFATVSFEPISGQWCRRYSRFSSFKSDKLKRFLHDFSAKKVINSNNSSVTSQQKKSETFFFVKRVYSDIKKNM